MLWTAAGAPLPTHPAAQYWVASPCQPQAQSSAIPALPVYENMLAVQTAGNIPPPAYSPITAASAPVGMPCNKIWKERFERTNDKLQPKNKPLLGTEL